MLLELCDYLIICLHVRWLKLKQFDIWRGGDELHCATAAWSLIYFQHISYYHVAFQKASLAHPTRVKGKGTSCIWNSTCKSSHIQILPTSGTHIHTHTLIRNRTRACGSAIAMLRHPREPCHRASRFQGCMDGAPSLDMKAPESVRHMFKTLHINANSLRYEIIPTVLALWPPKIKALKNAATLCP